MPESPLRDCAMPINALSPCVPRITLFSHFTGEEKNNTKPGDHSQWEPGSQSSVLRFLHHHVLLHSNRANGLL